MYRILQVCGGLRQGGAETMIMNVYRAIDRKKIQFDFLVYNDETTFFTNEIKKLGGRVIVLDRKHKWNIIRYNNEFQEIIKTYGPYKAVHVHTNSHSGLPLWISKRASIPIRVCHSHSTLQQLHESISRKIYRFIMKHMILENATVLAACGKQAGIALYGENCFLRKGVIIPNAVDINLYLQNYSVEINELRKQLHLDDECMIIGSVASFKDVKNHAFMLTIASRLKTLKINFVMIFVGDGILRNNIQKEASSLGLTKNIIFLGVRQDIPLLMQLFDVLLMPSLYEGFPVTLVESQAAGLPAVISDKIPNEVDLHLNLIGKHSLDSDVDEWVHAIIYAANKLADVSAVVRKSVITKRKLDIHDSVRIFYKIYGITQ
ncbi:glycosyltransferase family 1 protein [Megasphaera paucivorans]|uniref:Glycosyltransferase involved in cell wall bisynthesis n=1 Tax=Megasphaera paucivorans TaxID=349095 RepID=A0A1G9W0X1_9FIRM|nr:glycosyltransferase family 1 protein [Megasphaera paucivorans]SDM78140.1 Glycosyltransferase involved in cell wall bisynthesis [Megasphaera paucivorans]